MGLVRITLAVAALAAITACSGPVKAVPASYYLALGDSLSQGVQPDMAGANVETRQGYADQLYAALRSGHPGLQLVKFGCPGETTSTMINGGICRYPGGSQLAAAAAFLRAHRGRVFLITIDIGANDPEDCGSRASLSKIASCFGTGVPRADANLATIMTRLRAAAGPGVFSKFFGGLILQTYLTEMLSARFVSEGISNFVKVEAAIDDRLDAGSIDGSHEIQLMLSASDN